MFVAGCFTSHCRRLYRYLCMFVTPLTINKCHCWSLKVFILKCNPIKDFYVGKTVNLTAVDNGGCVIYHMDCVKGFQLYYTIIILCKL